MSMKDVWDSLVGRADDARASAIGERFTDAVEQARAAAGTRDRVLRRYLGEEYDAVVSRSQRLEPEDEARIMVDRIMLRVADRDPSSADLRAIGDAIDRLGELDLELGHAIDGLRVVFEEAVDFRRSKPHAAG
jgi:hypothetical protein